MMFSETCRSSLFKFCYHTVVSEEKQSAAKCFCHWYSIELQWGRAGDPGSCHSDVLLWSQGEKVDGNDPYLSTMQLCSSLLLESQITLMRKVYMRQWTKMKMKCSIAIIASLTNQKPCATFTPFLCSIFINIWMKEFCLYRSSQKIHVWTVANTHFVIK